MGQIALRLAKCYFAIRILRIKFAPIASVNFKVSGGHCPMLGTRFPRDFVYSCNVFRYAIEPNSSLSDGPTGFRRLIPRCSYDDLK